MPTEIQGRVLPLAERIGRWFCDHLCSRGHRPGVVRVDIQQETVAPAKAGVTELRERVRPSRIQSPGGVETGE
jgi:hypothetical protein